MAEGRRQYADLTERARTEAERQAAAGRAAHERFVADGRAEQARLVSQTEVVQAARLEAARIVDTADGEADRLRRDCDAYVDTTLGDLEESLGNALQTVNRSRASMWRGPGRPVAGAGAAAGAVGNGHGSDRLILRRSVPPGLRCGGVAGRRTGSADLVGRLRPPARAPGRACPGSQRRTRHRTGRGIPRRT